MATKTNPRERTPSDEYCEMFRRLTRLNREAEALSRKMDAYRAERLTSQEHYDLQPRLARIREQINGTRSLVLRRPAEVIARMRAAGVDEARIERAFSAGSDR